MKAKLLYNFLNGFVGSKEGETCNPNTHCYNFKRLKISVLVPPT